MVDPELLAELRAVARKLLAATPSPLERGLLAEVGWLGLEVPERFGGAGASFPEVAVVLEELGRARARSTYLGSTVLPVAALTLLAPFPERDHLLAATASGETSLCVVLATGETAEPPFQIVDTDAGLRIFGSADFVPDVVGADRLLLLARDPTDEPVLVRVAVDAAGLEVTQQTVLDETRSVAAVIAEALPIAAPDIWHFRAAPNSSATLLRCRAALAVACDSFGVAEAMLEATVAYAKVRHQFGRPIGSFQGVKFACADMLVSLRIAQELLTTAVDALTFADPESGCEQIELDVAPGQGLRLRARRRHRRQGATAARRDRLHLGEWHPYRPQASRAEPVVVRLPCRAPQAVSSRTLRRGGGRATQCRLGAEHRCSGRLAEPSTLPPDAAGRPRR